MNSKKRVLFMCIENSNRSQMAEAFAKILGGNSVEAFSAGSKPSGAINPKAIKAMHELGYDLTTHTSKELCDVPDCKFDFVATMGCGDNCNSVNSSQKEDWAFPDPKNMSPDEYNNVRDEIRNKVYRMLVNIGVELPKNA